MSGNVIEKKGSYDVVGLRRHHPWMPVTWGRSGKPCPRFEPAVQGLWQRGWRLPDKAGNREKGTADWKYVKERRPICPAQRNCGYGFRLAFNQRFPQPPSVPPEAQASNVPEMPRRRREVRFRAVESEAVTRRRPGEGSQPFLLADDE